MTFFLFFENNFVFQFQIYSPEINLAERDISRMLSFFTSMGSKKGKNELP